MSLRIEIGDKWIINSDQYQFILSEKKVVKSGRKAGEEWLDTIGYYPKIEQLISGLIHHHIQQSTITSIEEMAAEIKRTEKCAPPQSRRRHEKTHQLKIRPEFFQAVINGTKKPSFVLLTVRFAVGDLLCLNEYGPCEYDHQRVGFTGALSTYW